VSSSHTLRRYCTQVTSVVTNANKWDSTARQWFFFGSREMRLQLRKMQPSVVDWRSSRSPDQAASKNAIRRVEDWVEKARPNPRVPLRYQRMRLTTTIWVVIGEYNNWPTGLAAKVILGRVIVKYCKDPTKLWYKEASSKNHLEKQRAYYLDFKHVFHSRTKYIEIDYHFVCELLPRSEDLG
jgi:hypothetical protein